MTKPTIFESFDSSYSDQALQKEEVAELLDPQIFDTEHR
jgi:hypothetical protein